jgi:hypothetical protein
MDCNTQEREKKAVAVIWAYAASLNNLAIELDPVHGISQLLEVMAFEATRARTFDRI